MNEKENLSKKIREAEFKNILQKLKDGKTLSARESKIASEFAQERDGDAKPLTQVELAKLWGMTQPNIHKMVKKGMPLSSLEAAENWRRKFLEEKGRGADAPPSLNEARLRKTLLECERIEFALAIERKAYVKYNDVREAGIKIGAILSAQLAALVNDTSGALAGLDEITVKKKMHERTQSVLMEFKNELEKEFA
jgi:hypothetical protein